MNSFYSMTIAAVLVASLGTSLAGGVVPAAVSAPVIAAPAAVGYAKAVPYNIPPFASRVDISTRALAAPYVAAAPIVAAPAAPVVAAHAAPIVAGPAPVVAAHAAPLIAAPAPLTYGAYPAPIAAAPGLVHPAYAARLAAPFAAYAAHAPAIYG